MTILDITYPGDKRPIGKIDLPSCPTEEVIITALVEGEFIPPSVTTEKARWIALPEGVWLLVGDTRTPCVFLGFRK